MHEALGMGRYLAQHLNERAVLDGGARYRIVVVDRAGNSCEVRHETHGLTGQGRWVTDDDVSREAIDVITAGR